MNPKEDTLMILDIHDVPIPKRFLNDPNPLEQVHDIFSVSQLTDGVPI